MYIHKLYNDDGNEFATKIEVEGGKPVTHILLHPDAQSVFVSTTGPDVVQYSISSGDKLREFKGEAGGDITALAFSTCNHQYAEKIDRL